MSQEITEKQTVDVTKLFRPNPERAIYLNGVIDQTMVGALTPRIVGLQAVCSDPITVYINSSGGVLVCAHMIEGLLKTRSMDGDDRRVIGVGVGFAASAAADLLIGCNYAIAYPSCQILCHGTRYEADEPVTLEHADRFSRDLKKEDDVMLGSAKSNRIWLNSVETYA